MKVPCEQGRPLTCAVFLHLGRCRGRRLPLERPEANSGHHSLHQYHHLHPCHSPGHWIGDGELHDDDDEVKLRIAPVGQSIRQQLSGDCALRYDEVDDTVLMTDSLEPEEPSWEGDFEVGGLQNTL